MFAVFVWRVSGKLTNALEVRNTSPGKASSSVECRQWRCHRLVTSYLVSAGSTQNALALKPQRTEMVAISQRDKSSILCTPVDIAVMVSRLPGQAPSPVKSQCFRHNWKYSFVPKC